MSKYCITPVIRSEAYVVYKGNDYLADCSTRQQAERLVSLLEQIPDPQPSGPEQKASLPMTLADLRDGQAVRYRLGTQTDNYQPVWLPWARGTLYLTRRLVPLPRRYKRHSRSPNVGDIVTIAIQSTPYEFSQGDYEQGTGIFNCEDNLLEIEGLR